MPWQNSPVRTLYLEIMWKFLTVKVIWAAEKKYREKKMLSNCKPHLIQKDGTAKPKLFLSQGWAIQCNHLSATKATGAGRIRIKTHTWKCPPQQGLCSWHKGIAQGILMWGHWDKIYLTVNICMSFKSSVENLNWNLHDFYVLGNVASPFFSFAEHKLTYPVSVKVRLIWAVSELLILLSPKSEIQTCWNWPLFSQNRMWNEGW